MSTKKPSKEGKLKKCLKAPIKMLTKAKDFYINGMTEWSNHLSYCESMGCPTAQANTLPRSCSVSSSSTDEDYRELLRVASTKSLNNKIKLDFLQRQQSQRSPTTGSNSMPRSKSIGFARIDEEKASDFEEDVNERTDLIPRSKSYAFPRTGVF